MIELEVDVAELEQLFNSICRDLYSRAKRRHAALREGQHPPASKHEVAAAAEDQVIEALYAGHRALDSRL